MGALIAIFIIGAFIYLIIDRVCESMENARKKKGIKKIPHPHGYKVEFTEDKGNQK